VGGTYAIAAHRGGNNAVHHETGEVCKGNNASGKDQGRDGEQQQADDKDNGPALFPYIH
jgi:hypothetical protein